MLYEGNEGQNPQSQVLIEQMNAGIKAVLSSSLPASLGDMVEDFITENAMPMFDTQIRSMLEDRNHCGTPQEVVVDDHRASFKF